MKKGILTLLAVLLVVVGCQKVPISGRKQMRLLPKSSLNSMALDSYKQFLSQHTLSNNAKDREMVSRVGTRIQGAVERYFKAVNKEEYLAGYAWEFNLVQDNLVNAWAMPGGKTVVYTGLLPVTKTEDGLAVVMGHEIAHAIANHGNERMSQGLVLQLGGVGLSVALQEKPEETQNLFLTAYGVGATVGAMLPFSRLHESEADELGLIFMAMAGYDPEEGSKLWMRMAESSGGVAPPEFLSTHPSHETRIKKLKEAVPKAKAYAQKYSK